MNLSSHSIDWYSSDLACGGKMCQSLVAVKTFIFYCRKWFFLLPQVIAVFAWQVAVRSLFRFQSLVAVKNLSLVAVSECLWCQGIQNQSLVAVSGWDLGFELGSCFWKRPTFLLLALGSALENVAAIVNPQNKPTKVNWIISWPSAFEISRKCSLIRVQ